MRNTTPNSDKGEESWFQIDCSPDGQKGRRFVQEKKSKKRGRRRDGKVNHFKKRKITVRVDTPVS